MMQTANIYFHNSGAWKSRIKGPADFSSEKGLPTSWFIGGHLSPWVFDVKRRLLSGYLFHKDIDLINPKDPTP